MSQFSEDFLKVYSKAHGVSQGWVKFKKNAHKNTSTDELNTKADIILRRSVRDLDDNSYNSFHEHHRAYFGDNNCENSKWKTLTVTPAPRSSTGARASLYSVSPSGNIQLSFYNSPLKKGETTGSYVEINHACPHIGIYRFDLTQYHDKIIGDTWFGGCSWSEDEETFVYVAQINKDTIKDKKTKRSTFIDSINSEDNSLLSGKKYEYVDDWGEKYEGVNDLGIFIFNIYTGKVKMLPNIDLEKYTVGQPHLFSVKNDNLSLKYNEDIIRYFISYTAWDINPRRLGMIYCYHRKCQLFLQEVTQFVNEFNEEEEKKDEKNEENEEKKLTKKDEILKSFLSSPLLLSSNLSLARSSRYSSKSNLLIFLGREEPLYSHGGSSELFSINFSLNFDFKLQKVVSSVYSPQLITNNITFPGIFCDTLNENPFDTTGNFILMETDWGNQTRIIGIDLLKKDNNIINFEFEDLDNSIYSFNILNYNKNYLLLSYSSSFSPIQHLLINLNTIQLNSNENIFISKELIRYSSTSSRICISSKLSAPICSHLSTKISPWKKKLILKNFYHNTDSTIFSSFLLLPLNISKSIPILLVPHGGPHSNSSSSFLPSYYFLASTLNIGILHINYRGSTGFGMKSIESLLGNVGRNDVDDVIFCLDNALNLTVNDVLTEKEREDNQIGTNFNVFDPFKVGIVGGSHGGFLAAHVCGQFPERFKVCCLRNPVINIPSMVGVSDIPGNLDYLYFPHKYI